MSQLPAKQQYAPATVQALRDAERISYADWSRNWDFVRAQREGRVQYHVHLHHHEHSGTVRHAHYDGGRLPPSLLDSDW